jgi:hypothetical protein
MPALKNAITSTHVNLYFCSLRGFRLGAGIEGRTGSTRDSDEFSNYYKQFLLFPKWLENQK